LKKDIPAKPLELVRLINLILFFDIPPRATISLFESFDIKLNLFIPRKLLFSLKIEDIKILLTFCFSLILISLTLWAEPINKNFFLNVKPKWEKSLLNEGKYAPSKSNLIDNFILLDIKNFSLLLLQ